MAVVAPGGSASPVEADRTLQRLLRSLFRRGGPALDVCHQLVAGRRLGLPGAEEDVLDKLESVRLLTPETVATLRRMKGCRSILVHEYGHVLDELIFEEDAPRQAERVRMHGEPEPARDRGAGSVRAERPRGEAALDHREATARRSQ